MTKLLNVLFVGDVVGKPGRNALAQVLPGLVEERDAHLVVTNVENAAGGFGMSKKIHDQLAGLGVDVMTSGNHVWDRKEFVKEIEECERLVRPANYPPEAPGKGHVVIETDFGPVAVVNLAGRVFMPPVDCPFRGADRVLEELERDVRVILIDFHAEATSEKQALGYYLDGRVAAVVGTHTHVPTADQRILPEGTAYLSDLGMVGPRDSIIGVMIQPALHRFLTGLPARFEIGGGPVVLGAALVAVNPDTGKAVSIETIHRELDKA